MRLPSSDFEKSSRASSCKSKSADANEWLLPRSDSCFKMRTRAASSAESPKATAEDEIEVIICWTIDSVANTFLCCEAIGLVKSIAFDSVISGVGSSEAETALLLPPVTLDTPCESNVSTGVDGIEFDGVDKLSATPKPSFPIN